MNYQKATSDLRAFVLFSRNSFVRYERLRHESRISKVLAHVTQSSVKAMRTLSKAFSRCGVSLDELRTKSKN